MAEGRTPYEAADGDWYVEPEVATAFLLDREPIGEVVWDPCCGQGNILIEAHRRGHEVFGSDIVDRRQGGSPFHWSRLDFLANWPLPRSLGGMSILMNPPYGKAKLAEAFIRKAVSLPGADKVCVFVNSKFLFGSGRSKGLWTDLPPTRVYPVNPRPSCPPGEFLLAGGRASGGVENFAWLVYDLADKSRRTEMILGAAGALSCHAERSGQSQALETTTPRLAGLE